MATEKSLTAGNLGTVLDTYGGKSLKRIIAVGVIVFGCGLIVGLFIRSFGPDYFGPGFVVVAVALVFAIAHVRLNWEAAFAKVEVCKRGVRLLYRDGVTELPWDRIRKIKVGYFRWVKGSPEHVVFQTTDGNKVELLFGFWAAVGTVRFTKIIRKFVEDVEERVEFCYKKRKSVS
jgi:hypothetical protein